MTKKALYILPLSALLLLAVFWEPIMGSLITTTLNSYCQRHFGSELTTEGIRKEAGRWIIEKPRLDQSDTQLSASRLLIGFGIRPLDREIDFEVVLEDARVNLNGALGGVEPSFSSALVKILPYWLLKVNSRITVNEGAIAWFHGEGETREQRTATFYFSANAASEQQEARVALLLDGQSRDTNCFEATIFKQDASPLLGELTFRQVACQDLAAIYENLGNPLEGWTLDSGTIDGRLQVVFPEHDRPYVWGDATLKGLRFQHSQKKIAGEIKEAKLDLEMDRDNKRTFPVLGKVVVSDEASLVLHRGGIPFWKVTNFLGGIEFLPDQEMKIRFEGLCEHYNHSFNLNASGEARLYDESQASLDVLVRLTHSNRREAEAHFVARQLGAFYNVAEVELKNIGSQEFNFIQTALGKYFPDWQSLDMHEGYLDATGLAYLQKYQITELKVDNIVAKGWRFDYKPLDITFSMGSGEGKGSINLTSANPLQTVDGDFSIRKGNLKLPALNENTLLLEDITTAIAIRKGVVQKSEMQGRVAGLNGTIIVDWLSKNEAIQLQFQGGAEKLFPFAPESIQNGLKKTFSKSHITLMAGMTWKHAGAIVSGKLKVGDPTQPGELIAFGFDIEKSSEDLWKSWPADNLAASYWKHAGLEALQMVLPPIVAPTVLLETNWIKSESGIAGLVLRSGWFQADNLPLKKYLSPFVFPKNQVALTGNGDFQGVFDHSRLAVEYVGNDVTLENKLFTLEAKRIQALDHPQQHARLYAAHYVDFETGQHFGSLPLAGASYFDKNSGLLFTDVNTYITFEGQKVHLSDLEAQCNGIHFLGAADADFDFPGDGVYEVEIRSHKLVGKVSQVQHLLNHFDADFFFLDVPLEGDVAYGQKGGYLHFAFQPDGCIVKADVNGVISNGQLSMANTDASLKDVGMRFAYNYENRSLEFSHIQGTLKLEEGGQTEEYLLAGDHIRFDDYEKDVADFDVWLGDETRDIVRLVGTTTPRKTKEGSPLFDVHLNKDLTHFGDVHPRAFRLVMGKGYTVEKFRLGLGVRLNTVLHDLQRFSSLGAAFLPKSALRHLRSVQSASGKLRVDIRRDKGAPMVAYRLKGEAINIGETAFDKCLLVGSANGEQCLVEELSLDDWMLKADLKQNAGHWDLREMSLQYGEALRLELAEGKEVKEEGFKAQVKNLELNLEALASWSAVEAFAEEYSPHGHLSATGEVRLMGAKAFPYYSLEAQLDVQGQTLAMKGLHFQDVKGVSCHVVSDKGVTIRNVETALLEPTSRAVRSQVGAEELRVEFFTGELLFSGLHFNVPAHHLPWTTEALSEAFPDFMGPSITDAIRNIKLQGNLEGIVDFELSPPYMAVKLALKDGRYHFLNSEHDVRELVLEYDPFEFKMESLYDLEGHPLRLNVHSTSPTLEHGELVMNSLDKEDETNISDALAVNWENDPTTGLSIQTAQGTLSGLTMSLQRDETQPLSEAAMFLLGEVAVDARAAKAFFPEDVARKVTEWQVGDGYRLKGKWRVQKEGGAEYSDKLHFFGTLEGENLLFKGFQFDTLASHLEYTPDSIRVRDLVLQDAAGALTVEKVDVLKKGEAGWEFALPLMRVSKFRPSLLRDADMPRTTARKPLIVRELLLENCQGRLAEASTITGSGELMFTNRSAKLLQNTIFYIPSEILSHIGLDLSVMTPVAGRVYYKLQDGLIYLTKFKDIYSDGKLSKFFLADAPPSTMDFDGNLNVRIRMKQNNLLFKLTELFMVNIKGNLQKPAYSLQKHRKEG